MPGKLQRQAYNGRLTGSSDRVNLLLSGFYKQDIISTDEVIEALEALPQSHIERLHVIKYDPERLVQQVMAWSRSNVPKEAIMGAYYHCDTPGIVLYAFHSLRQFYRMLYHEIGHFVQFKVISQELRDEWFFRVRPGCRRFVSEYAKLNGAEDFAECYSFFCVYPEKLWQLPEKMQFMAEKIFYLTPGSYDFSQIDPYGGVEPAYPVIE